MSDQKTGILNAMNTIATINSAETITDHIVEVGVDNVTLESVSGLEDVSEACAKRVIGALDLHKTLSENKPRKKAERGPTKLEQYISDTPEEERDRMAIEVAIRRINSEGGRPRAWRSIRDELGLRNEEFHKVIRVSDGWIRAVVGRIAQLKLDNPDWNYSGKLDVLTGIDGFSMEMVDPIVAKYKAEKATQEIETEEVESQNNEVDLQAVVESAPTPVDSPLANAA